MTDRNKIMLQSLGSGLVGACVLTALHETARQFIDDTPRADILGMRAIKPEPSVYPVRWDLERPPAVALRLQL